MAAPPRKIGGALPGQRPAGAIEVNLQPCQGVGVRRRHEGGVDDGHSVGGSVMLPGQEEGLLGYQDPHLGHQLAHCRAIENRGRDACAVETAVAAGCPAVEGRGKGVVLSLDPPTWPVKRELLN